MCLGPSAFGANNAAAPHAPPPSPPRRSVLLLFPLRYPHLARFTCWDGLVELNTLCLIARRQLRFGRGVTGPLYWASFFPLRMGLYPYLLLRFWQEMQVCVNVCGEWATARVAGWGQSGRFGSVSWVSQGTSSGKDGAHGRCDGEE